MIKGVTSFGFALGLILASFHTSAVFATDAIPMCRDGGRPLPINNEQILEWKEKKPNQFKDRGHIRGRLVEIYKDKTGHDHFSIQIGDDPDERIEGIYNQSFGALPEQLEKLIGADVEACGDFIMSTAPYGRYPASPDGAIIHWIHMSPPGNRHDSGFLVIDGILYGQVDPDDDGGRRDRRDQKNWRDRNGPDKNDWNARKNNGRHIVAETNQLFY